MMPASVAAVHLSIDSSDRRSRKESCHDSASSADDRCGRIVAWLEHQWVGDGRVAGSPPTMRHGSEVGPRVAGWQTSTRVNDGRAHRGVNESVPCEGQRGARLRRMRAGQLDVGEGYVIPVGDAAGPSRPDEVSPSDDASNSAEAKERSRYIPSETRERVLHQAGYRCEFVGSDQHRCGVRTGLQIDHVVPFSKDGSNDETDLRALCPTHNAWYAEQEFGAEFMRSKIAASRKSSGPIDQPTRVREPRPQYRATRHPAKRHRAARGPAIDRSTRIPSGRGVPHRLAI